MDMHLQEDTSKAENRLNITLFHLFMNEKIKKFITEKLGLNEGCIIFPSSGLITEDFITSHRPDYGIKSNGEIVGYIEVELGKDPGQVKKYESLVKKNVKIYSIFGKEEYDCDLSLVEIYNYINDNKEQICTNCQVRLSVELLLELIKHYVIDGNFKSNNKRTPISDEMMKTPIIESIYKSICDSRIIDKEGAKIVEGKVLLDSISENGFSIRVYSKIATKNTLSIMARSKGLDQIEFPSYKKLKKYLPDNEEFVEEYTQLLISLGAKTMRGKSENQKVKVSILDVQENIDSIINLIKTSFL